VRRNQIEELRAIRRRIEELDRLREDIEAAHEDLWDVMKELEDAYDILQEHRFLAPYVPRVADMQYYEWAMQDLRAALANLDKYDAALSAARTEIESEIAYLEEEYEEVEEWY